MGVYDGKDYNDSNVLNVIKKYTGGSVCLFEDFEFQSYALHVI